MYTVVATLESISPYSQSRQYEVERLGGGKESHADYEKRTWRERLHVDDNGYVFIPPMQFKKSIEFAAAFLSMNIKGKGKATYTKHFRSGVLVMEGLTLPVKKDDVQGEWLSLTNPGQGKGLRVTKCMPVIPHWKGDVAFHILDETITPEIFETHLKEAGNFIGIGRFRPERGGFYGRFKVLKIVRKG